jgi:Asp-tRNA(Asn)/Glu-tRNA(Gln) amidotransferase A subunit family amidase
MRAGTIAALVAGFLAIGAGAQPAWADGPPLDLEKTSAVQLEAMMSSGQLTSYELTRAYLDRIAAVNRRGPSINAVRSLNPDALKEARASDAARAAGGPRGPLEGLPVLLKDNVDVAGMASTANSIALEHSVPDKDAFVVRKLRAAGAVILGKTNLTEFAAYVSNNQQSGNGSLGGQVLNPYDTANDPGGSSAGSGVAAAAGLAALTIGSDSEGSIISPATQNGVVGVRPSTGLWSRTGVVPISETQDTLGPLTQTVADAALLLGAATGVDPADPRTAESAGVAGTDYMAALSPTALQGARIGVMSSNNAQYTAARAALTALGATVVQVTFPNFTTSDPILPREFRRDLTKYLTTLPASAPIKSFDEAYDYLKAHPQEGLKYGDSRMQPSSTYHLEIPSEEAEYEATRDAEIAKGKTYLDNLLNQGAGTADDLDAVLQLQLGLISQAAFAGYPIVSVPGGFPADTGRPINVTFVGRRFSEAKLLGYAYAYEQATHNRKVPSEVNPASWRCVAGPRYDPHSCAPYSGFAGPLTDALVAPALNLEELTVAEIQRRFAAGTLTSSDLVKAYLDRIRFVNQQGPGINAVRAIDPTAVGQAIAADQARAAGHPGGPLAGVPVLVSDTIDVAGLPTTGGSMALEGLIPSQDSELVKRLRAAGAIILGKANVTELSGMVSTGMPAGYGSLSGQVLNPYDMRAGLNGSSAGAVAAAASGLAAATIGVETDASTSGTGGNATNSTSISALVPAVATGVVAMRPTLGLVGRTGVLPVARSQETPAPIGRTVADVAATLSGIVGRDPDDDATAGAPDTAPDYTAALNKNALAGQRIGIVAPTSGSSLAAFTAAQAAVTGAGGIAVPLTAPTRPSTAKIVDRETGRDVAAYLARYGAAAPVHSLSDIAAFDTAHPADTLKFGQARLTAAAAIDLTNPATAATYQADLTNGRTLSRAYVDNLLANAGAPVAAIMSLPGVTAEVGTRAGYPQIVVPAGYDATLRRPLAISFTGTAGDDAKLIGFAYAYERAAAIRQTPSEINPQTWHCVAPIVYLPRTCGPGEPLAPEPNPAIGTAPVGGNVPATLSLTLGPPASFGAFTPGVAHDYTAATSANVISSAGDAALSVADPSATATGHLVNGAFSLASALQVRADNGPFAPIGGSSAPTPLLAYTGPVSNDPVTLEFKQPIAATDVLRTGAYTKTLTLTLSTTSP